MRSAAMFVSFMRRLGVGAAVGELRGRSRSQRVLEAYGYARGPGIHITESPDAADLQPGSLGVEQELALHLAARRGEVGQHRHGVGDDRLVEPERREPQLTFLRLELFRAVPRGKPR